MPDLTVTKALPNPIGKDSSHGRPVSNQQLNGEWVEFKSTNSEGKNLTMDGVSISHTTFTHSCQRTGEERLMTFNGALAAGYSVRVHTGNGEPYDEGTVRHLFANRGNYVWNNGCGDTAILRAQSGGEIDSASYAPHPSEGVVLVRIPGTHTLSPAYAGVRT
jgi:hypothetical protein